ncbi:MAG: hypothetical protein ACPF9I_06455 [Candidatus Thalassarchaeaceae archaeon]
MNEKNENKTKKTMNAKLKLTGFQRMCINHALGVDYEYEDYDDRGSLTADQCRDAQDWLLDRVAMYFPYRAEEKWKPITITIPDDILESVVFVLDNAVDASTILEDGYMYGSEYNVPEGLADSIIARTKDLIEEQIEALRAVIP